MVDKSKNKTVKRLPIRPMKIHGKIKKIPISKLTPGTYKEKSIEISKAVVAYFDVLGFSNKKDAEEIEMTLLDFSAPLAISSTKFKNVRFNIFSDCAFVAASRKNAAELLSAIRFAFTQWTADGILVRGGLALGTYKETHSIALDMTLTNFVGNLFSGSGVVEAVKQEGSGHGSLMFAEDQCAKFFAEKHKEPIFTLANHKIIGWSDDDFTLCSFAAISLLRLIKVLSQQDKEQHSVDKHLLNNLLYSVAAASSPLPTSMILAVLSLPNIDPKGRERALAKLELKDPENFLQYKELINEWLKKEETMKFLQAIAYMDSSIPE